jgi:hypothetical protein
VRPFDIAPSHVIEAAKRLFTLIRSAATNGRDMTDPLPIHLFEPSIAVAAADDPRLVNGSGQ